MTTKQHHWFINNVLDVCKTSDCFFVTLTTRFVCFKENLRITSFK